MLFLFFYSCNVPFCIVACGAFSLAQVAMCTGLGYRISVLFLFNCGFIRIPAATFRGAFSYFAGECMPVAPMAAILHLSFHADLSVIRSLQRLPVPFRVVMQGIAMRSVLRFICEEICALFIICEICTLFIICEEICALHSIPEALEMSSEDLEVYEEVSERDFRVGEVGLRS